MGAGGESQEKVQVQREGREETRKEVVKAARDEDDFIRSHARVVDCGVHDAHPTAAGG